MHTDKDDQESSHRELIEHTKGTINFFSNLKKTERERCVVRAFLRFLGIPFQEDDFRVSQPEPIDVAVFDAKFQVTEVLKQGRKRHEEVKKRLAELEAASDERYCEIEWENPSPMGWGELVCSVEGVFGRKTASPDIDLLVHIALGQRFLNLKSETADLSIIATSGWRSVSLVFPPHSIILYASNFAPSFLKARVGAICNKWESPEGWYEKATTTL
jgi:hypothetical protein